MNRLAGLLRVALPGLLLAGCTGLELPALGAAAISAGAGSAVKAGTEYTMGGTAFRTFSVPLEDLSRQVRRTFDRLELPVTAAAAHGPRLALTAEGIGRTVHVELTPITPALTRLKLAVRQNAIRNDRSTASELIAQIEREVNEPPLARAGK